MFSRDSLTVPKAIPIRSVLQ